MREFTEEVAIELLKGFKAIMDDSIKKFLNDFRNDLKVVQERVLIGFDQASSTVVGLSDSTGKLLWQPQTESLISEGCEELNKGLLEPTLVPFVELKQEQMLTGINDLKVFDKMVVTKNEAKDGEVMMEDESMETNGGWRSSVALSSMEHCNESIQDIWKVEGYNSK
ncbi:hypothetical protein V6N12_036049 [Hibiscus sabdariffa]|uniref:Uncharacterized protein n=1 Tax=Hibiscus sabdariffa TaxID=183260 RepID=A0ABR2ERC2_9ROSI